MTTPTSPWNIPLFAPSDTIPSLEGVLNSISTGLNTALNTMNIQTFARYATKSAMPTTGLSIGQHATVYADSTAAYNGDYVATSTTQWRKTGTGYTLLVPTSVTGGTVNADGSVSFSAAASVDIDGIFTTLYDRYVVEFDQTAATANTNIKTQLRAGGTLNATTYFWNIIWSQGSTPSGTQGLNDAGFQLTAFPSLYRAGRLEFINPAVSSIRTMLLADFTDTDTSNMGQVHASGWHGTLAAYDGFRIAPLAAGPTISGRIRIYGLSNG